MRDLMSSLRTLVLAESTITDLVGTRVFVNRIPRATIEAEDTFHPSKMLVLRQAGGFGKADLLHSVNRTVTALCYGETDFEAERVRLVVEDFFTRINRALDGDLLVHDINSTGGPLPNVEPDLVWPAIAQTFTVMANLLEAA